MALALTLTYSASNTADNCGEAIIDDTTGTYDAGSNPGGYGAPNEDRADLALYLFAIKKGYNTADVELSYTNVDAEADTVASWTVPVSVDGWHRFRVLGIPQWDSGTSYALNQVVWENDDLFIATTAGTTIGDAPSGAGSGEWSTTVPTLATIYDDPVTYGPTTTVHIGERDQTLFCLSNKCYADLVSDGSKGGCCDDCAEENKNTLCDVEAMLEGAKVAASRGRYLESEKKVLIVTDLCAGKDCFNCK